MMLNPYVILGGVVFWLASMFGAYQFGSSNATTYQKAECAKAAKIVADQVSAARDQSDAEKKTLQEYATSLGKNYVANLAKANKAAADLSNRTQAHVEQNPIATDPRCNLPADLLRDINDAGGNTEGNQSESGSVGAATVPLATPRAH